MIRPALALLLLAGCTARVEYERKPQEQEPCLPVLIHTPGAVHVRVFVDERLYALDAGPAGVAGQTHLCLPRSAAGLTLIVEYKP